MFQIKHTYSVYISNILVNDSFKIASSPGTTYIGAM